ARRYSRVGYGAETISPIPESVRGASPSASSADSRFTNDAPMSSKRPASRRAKLPQSQSGGNATLPAGKKSPAMATFAAMGCWRAASQIVKLCADMRWAADLRRHASEHPAQGASPQGMDPHRNNNHGERRDEEAQCVAQ